MTEELVIDETNFDSLFFDVRKHKPKRGQVMVRYAASAEFVAGRLKADVVDLIYNKGRAEAATRVMRKLGCAADRDAIRVCREMAEDLAAGMTPEQVEEKPYPYSVEMFFYTAPENVPDDTRWQTISLRNLDEFLDAADNRLKIKSRVVTEDAPG